MNKHIRTVAGILALSLVFSCGVAVGRENIRLSEPITASAGNAMSYNEFTYRVEENNEITILLCDSKAVNVEIPAEISGLPVTSINQCAFMSNYNLESVIIPEGIDYIGESAFSGCLNLKSVNIAESVTRIGENAFSYCNSLESIDIPKNANIGKEAFKNCNNLKSVNIADGVTRIGESAFSCCTILESVVIPKGVEVIAEGAFENCTSLRSVEIPKGVVSIENTAFAACIFLESITIPKSVKSIDNDVFAGDINLKSLTILAPDLYISEYFLSNFGGTIYGYENSTAQAFAEKRNYNFESLGKAPQESANDDINGDINGDGFTDANDASIILAYYSYLSTTTDNPVKSIDEFMSEQ